MKGKLLNNMDKMIKIKDSIFRLLFRLPNIALYESEVDPNTNML